jgi:hypothetical protein
VDAGAKGPHDDSRDQVARDRGRGLYAEQQDQHRRHQRTATRTRHSDKKPDDGAAQDYVRVDMHAGLIEFTSETE